MITKEDAIAFVKQLEELKTDEVDDLKSRIQLAALAINQLNTNLLQRDKEIDRLNEELQLAEIALNPAKK